MRFLIVLLTLFSSAALAAGSKEDFRLDALHYGMKTLGFNPGAQLEKLTGLKVTACKMTGAKLETQSNDIGKCLLYAFFEYSRAYKEGIVDIEMTSNTSGRTLLAKLKWSPVPFRTQDPGWLDWVGVNRLMRYAAEIKTVIDYHLMNEMVFLFTTPVRVTDLSLPVSENLLQPFASMETDEIRVSTIAGGDKGTLSGHIGMTVWSETRSALLSVMFSTNWKLFTGDPLQAKIRGGLKHKYFISRPEVANEEN